MPPRHIQVNIHFASGAAWVLPNKGPLVTGSAKGTEHHRLREHFKHRHFTLRFNSNNNINTIHITTHSDALHP